MAHFQYLPNLVSPYSGFTLRLPSLKHRPYEGTPPAGDFPQEDATPLRDKRAFHEQLRNADVLRSIALQPDGKIVAAGDDNDNIVVLRFLSDLSIGTQEPEDAFTFSIQLNPASDFIEISTKTNFPEVGNFRKVEVLLYDSNNRLLRSAEFENNLRWEVGSLPAGVYWVQIQGVEKRSIGMFVKK